MAFQSLSDIASKQGRVTQSSYIMVSQSKRKNSDAIELTFRMSAASMEKIGVSVGSKIDVLYDTEENLWMIKKMPEGNGGFSLSGQRNKSGRFNTSAARVTWRPGFPSLSKEDTDETIKMSSKDDEIRFLEDAVIFRLT